MRAIRSFALVLCLVGGAAFGQSDPPQPFPAIKDWDSLVITFDHGCGRSPRPCPNYEVTVAGNGEVRFVGTSGVRATVEHTAHISRAAVRGLVAKFRAVKFFSHPNTRVMDSSGRVSISFDDHQKSLPREVAGDLPDAINKTAGTARWIGSSDTQR